MKRALLAAALLAASLTPALAAYDANGVALGATENDIKKRFPSAGAFCSSPVGRSGVLEDSCGGA